MQLSSLFVGRRIGRRGRWILLSAVVGTVSGLGAILFDILFRLAQSLLLERVGRFGPPTTALEGGEVFGPEQPWLLPVSLAVGGLLFRCSSDFRRRLSVDFSFAGAGSIVHRQDSLRTVYRP